MEDHIIHDGKVMQRLWDNHKNLGEIMRAEAVKMNVDMVARDGVRYVSLRDFYKRRSDGVWKPSSSGIVIPYIVPIKKGTELLKTFEQVMELLTQAGEEFESFPLLDKEHAVYIELKKNNIKKV